MENNETIFRLLFVTCTFFSLIFLMLIGTGAYDGYRMPTTGLSLDTSLVVNDVVIGSSAHIAGFQEGDQILKIDGVPVQAGDRIAAQGRRLAVGSITRYLVKRESGDVVDLDLKWAAPAVHQKIYVVLNAILALYMIVLSWITVLRRPRFTTSFIFFALSLVYVFFRMDHPRWTFELVARLYQALYLFGFFIIPPLFAHFCAIFPRKSIFFFRKEGRILWLYAPAIILFLPASVVNWTYYNDFKALHLITKIILYQGFILWTIYLFVGSLTMIRSFFRVRSRALSLRSTLVFYMLILSVLPYMLRSFVSQFWTNPFFFDILSLLLFFPVPASIAWAVMLGEDPKDGLPWYFDRIIRSKEE